MLTLRFHSTLILCLCAGYVAAVQNVAFAQFRSEPHVPAVEVIEDVSPGIQKIRAILDSDCKLEFDRVPLNKAMESISKEYGFNIWIDKTSLNDEGLEPTLPVTISVSGIRLKSALKLMLRDHRLTYDLADDVLKVTVHYGCDWPAIRVYPVGDLASTPEELADLCAALRIGNTLDQPWEAYPRNQVSLIPVVSAKALVIYNRLDEHESVLILLRDLRKAKAIADESQRNTRIPETSLPDMQSSPK